MNKPRPRLQVQDTDEICELEKEIKDVNLQIASCAEKICTIRAKEKVLIDWRNDLLAKRDSAREEIRQKHRAGAGG